LKINLLDVGSYLYNIENIGLEYIASYLRNHSLNVNLTTLSSDVSESDLGMQINCNYDLFGFSLFFTNVDAVYKIAKYIKMVNPYAKIFVGGRFATAAPKQILLDCEEIDFIILGDGEYPLLDVVKAISNKQNIDELPSVVTRNTNSDKKPSIVKFQDAKWPSRDLLEKCLERNYYVARLLSSRGCCANCSFCSHNSYTKIAKTKQWVGRDIIDVYNELISLYNTYGITSFIFNDGSFEDPGDLGKQRILQFCNLILSQSVKFTFFIFIRAESFTAEDMHLLDIMRKAGFHSVFIGLESANNNDLRIYNKNATAEINKSAYNLFCKQGFNVSIGFIMINPWSNKVSISDNFKFLCDIKFDSIDAYIRKLEIYYGSDIYNRLLNENMIVENSSYRDVYNYNFSDPYIRELDKFLNKLFKNSKHLKEEKEYVEFLNAFSELDYLFPDKTVKYKDRVLMIRMKYFQLLKEYFEVIFIQYDLKTAEERFVDFIENAQLLINEFKVLKVRIISDKNLYSYFIRDNTNKLF